MYSGRGRGRGRGRDFGGGRGSFGAGRSFPGGRQSAADKGPRHFKHCGWSNHIFKKCWEKFGRSEWAQLADSDPSVPCDTPHVSSSGSFTVILSQEEYDRLHQLEFFQNSHSVSHASSSGMHAYTVSPQKSWILDSRVSSYMTCIK